MNKQLISDLSSLSIPELGQLVGDLETMFGVKAPKSDAQVAFIPTFVGKECEQTEFDLELVSAGDKKIQVIKVIREITGLALKEAKDLVDGAPKIVKTGLSKADAETLKSKLEAEGGKVELR